MASADAARIKIGVDMEPFEWRVLHTSELRLEDLLNKHSQIGWDVFAVLPGCTIILRRPIETEYDKNNGGE